MCLKTFISGRDIYQIKIACFYELRCPDVSLKHKINYAIFFFRSLFFLIRN